MVKFWKVIKMWTLLFVIMTSGYSSQVKFEQIPMMDRIACQEAGNTFKNSSTGFAILCVSSNTGEVIKIRDKP